MLIALVDHLNKKMRKIRLFIAVSLDGYIARCSGSVDWLFTDADYGYTDFFKQIDTVLMGRKTYEQILTFGDYPYQGKQSFVFSQTLTKKTDPYVTFIHEDIANFVQQLKANEGQDIWLVGGAKLVQTFLIQGLLDEIILSIHPIILGTGIPLFIPISELNQKLTLTKTLTYNSGLLQVFFDCSDETSTN